MMLLHCCQVRRGWSEWGTATGEHNLEHIHMCTVMPMAMDRHFLSTQRTTPGTQRRRFHRSTTRRNRSDHRLGGDWLDEANLLHALDGRRMEHVAHPRAYIGVGLETKVGMMRI
jgi:hypothetical protein